MVRYGKALLMVALPVVFGTLAGCAFIFPPDDGDSGKAVLKKFGSEREFTDYFSDQMAQRNGQVTSLDRLVLEDAAADGAGGDADSGAPPQAAPSGPGGSDAEASDEGFSGTTLQEQGVDESDVVKTDGNYLYLMASAGDGSVLRIVDVRTRAEMTKAGDVAIEGWGQELYLNGDQVVTLTSTGGGIFWLEADVATGGAAEGGSGVERKPASTEPAADAPAPADAPVSSDGNGVSADSDADLIFAPGNYRYERPRTVVTVIDVSDRTAPVVVSSTAFDGSQASSRMIDGVLHLVVANYQDYYVDVMPMLGRPTFDTGGAVETETVIPRYTRIGANGSETSGDVLSWENFYRPEDPDGFGTVYVVSLDTEADASFTAVGVVSEPGLIYSSANALYLTDTNYDWTGQTRETTDIYKFAYEGRSVRPVAAGTVSGRILNQYSMGEHDEHLRTATTVGPTFDVDGQNSESSNNLYVLKQDGEGLAIVGQINDIAIGESIQSARFIGTRGYLVTFRQIDPLFTVDLSDPAAPKILGELKVPGFSTFIVPMDDNHLLTVGQYIPEDDTTDTPTFRPWAVQLSIFDVTDPTTPTLSHSAVIGADTGAYSEALWNPKAFNYYRDRGLVALPISVYGNIFGGGMEVIDVDVDVKGETDAADVPPPDGSGSDPSGGSDDVVSDEPYVPDGFDGLAVFSVSAEGGFAEMGRINTRFFHEGNFYWGSYTRGVFIGADVLAVTDQGVRGSPTSNVASEAYELMLEPVDIVGPPTIDIGEPNPGTDPSEPVIEVDVDAEGNASSGGQAGG